MAEFKERFAVCVKRCLDAELWAGQRVTFEGDYYQTHNATVYDADRPYRSTSLPAPVVARYAGRSATASSAPQARVRTSTDKLMPAVDEGLAAAGRADGSIDRMIEIKLSYDPDPRLALENTRFWAPLALTPEQKHGLSDPRQMEAAAMPCPSNR